MIKYSSLMIAQLFIPVCLFSNSGAVINSGIVVNGAKYSRYS